MKQGRRLSPAAIVTRLFFPAFEARKELAHHFLCLFSCQVLSRLLVDFLRELGAVVNHLLHSHILRKIAVLVAVDAIIFVWYNQILFIFVNFQC